MDDDKTLNKLLDEIYIESDKLEWSWTQLAEESGLAVSTVYNIGTLVTRRPQFRTVARLAYAVGYRLQLIKLARATRRIA